MKQEFGQLMLDRIKTYFPTGTFKTFYSIYEPVAAKRGYPYLLMHEGHSDEGMLTTSSPFIEIFYLMEIVDKYAGTTQDESAAQLYQQRSMQLADSLSDLMRNDTVLRNICMDFRAVSTKPQIAQQEDYAELRQPVEIRVSFNTNGGIYGYSQFGYAVYG